MERIGVRELRQNASRYLERVEAGETLEVTRRGEVVAVLGPPHPATRARDRLRAEGRLIPATLPFALPEPVVPAPGSPTNQELLDESREERL